MLPIWERGLRGRHGNKVWCHHAVRVISHKRFQPFAEFFQLGLGCALSERIKGCVETSQRS